jgi:hypothetical protein
MHSRNGRPAIFPVNQRGRGHEPVTVVGSSTPSVTVNTAVL